MFGYSKIDARLRKVEKVLKSLEQHADRTQNEWRQTREQIVDQMDEIRRILRPSESE